MSIAPQVAYEDYVNPQNAATSVVVSHADNDATVHIQVFIKDPRYENVMKTFESRGPGVIYLASEREVVTSFTAVDGRPIVISLCGDCIGYISECLDQDDGTIEITQAVEFNTEEYFEQRISELGTSREPKFENVTLTGVKVLRNSIHDRDNQNEVNVTVDSYLAGKGKLCLTLPMFTDFIRDLPRMMVGTGLGYEGERDENSTEVNLTPLSDDRYDVKVSSVGAEKCACLHALVKWSNPRQLLDTHHACNAWYVIPDDKLQKKITVHCNGDTRMMSVYRPLESGEWKVNFCCGLVMISICLILGRQRCLCIVYHRQTIHLRHIS